MCFYLVFEHLGLVCLWKDGRENDKLKKTGGGGMKTGVVDVGGGLRGIYAAGVFDGCLDNKLLMLQNSVGETAASILAR